MKIINTIRALCLGLAMIATASCQETRSVKVTVTEEDGSPIEGAQVSVWYMGYRPGESKEEKGNTNASGVFVAKGTPLLRMEATITKKGYYTSRSGRLSKKQDHEVTLVLRKMVNPIPLYAKKFRGKIPSIGKRYGFDFAKGDWVKPHGKGGRADLYFEVDIIRNKNGEIAGKLKITFPDEKEGCVVVNNANGYLTYNQLVMPNKARKNGYKSVLERAESGYQNGNKPRRTSYFFRTRAEKANTGSYSFNFTKFQKGIDFSMGGGIFLQEPYRSRYPNEYGALEFTYYYNPTPNDRNLEFDPKRNLFKNLDSTEQVREP